jgi:GNAT superfamily N-acetyltransferase/transcriptional regulator with XRE-family HTH domain
MDKVDELIASPSADGAKTVVSSVLKLLDMNSSQLAVALEVSSASVSRWANGQAVPHARQLRSIQELVRLKIQQLSEPDGLDFHGRKVAILSLDSFFRKAREAKNVYVLKNFLGFQAGINPAVKHQLRNLFAANNDLKICYGYPKDSEAAMTFLSFKQEVGSEWPMNIYWKEVEHDDKLMHLLGSVFSSPFIIEHRDGRIDVLLEVPVKLVRGLDEYDLSGYMSLFVELSDSHKHRLWSLWKPALEAIAWDSTPVRIRMQRTFGDKVVEVRDRAYDFLSSGRDEFDVDSFYVVAEIEGRTVGSIRLTDSSIASPLQRWINGQFPLPHGKGVVELTRGVVDPSKRNLGIYKWMMMRAVREALAAGFRFATAAVEEGYYLKEFLYRLGFEDVGAPVSYNDTPRTGTLCQSMVCDLTKSQSHWEKVQTQLDARTREKRLAIQQVSGTVDETQKREQPVFIPAER